MWVVLVEVGIAKFIFKLDETLTNIILWSEVVMLIMFGTSWLVKGKALADLGIQKDA